MKNYIAILFALLLFGCFNSSKQTDRQTNLTLEEIIRGKNALVDSVLNNKDKYELQIIYGKIDRNQNNFPILKDYYFNVNDNYFYPASVVKLIAAVLSLQKINELKAKGFHIDKNTTIIFEESSVGHPSAYIDTTSENGKPSIAQYIKKIFLVSDNDAYNRLFEFCGAQYINEELWKRGFIEARIAHRFFSSPNKTNSNLITNPFKFIDNNGNILYEEPERIWDKDLSNNAPNNKKGKGYVKDNKLIEDRFDFSKLNYISLPSLYKILQIVIFPEIFEKEMRFNLSIDDYQFLYKYMSMYPRESDYPKYEPYKKYFDGYCKFFMFGNTTDTIKESIRIFNKVGNAYGYTLDMAYIIDYEKKIEFFLAAVIYTNDNQVFNDDKYEYEEIAYPFMQEIGRIIYNYELRRERKYLPDLSKFNFWNK